MNKRQRIEEELAKIGITNETELNAAIKNLKPLNLCLMADQIKRKRAG